MKTIKEIFDKEDLERFRNYAGWFFGGDDGWLKKHNLGSYPSDINCLPKSIEFSLALQEKTNENTLLEMQNHLSKDIQYETNQIQKLEKEILKSKEEIKKRKEVMKILTDSKSFIAFFKAVINLK